MKPKCSKIDPKRRPKFEKMSKNRGPENDRKNIKKTAEKILPPGRVPDDPNPQETKLELLPPPTHRASRERNAR